MRALLLVAVGGAAGSVARYLVNGAALAAFGPGFAFGTLAVNVVGSLAMGILAALLVLPEHSQMRLLLMTGLLGGFTTFSAFSLDFLDTFDRDGAGAAALYLLASVGLSILAAAAGMAATVRFAP